VLYEDAIRGQRLAEASPGGVEFDMLGAINFMQAQPLGGGETVIFPEQIRVQII